MFIKWWSAYKYSHKVHFPKMQKWFKKYFHFHKNNNEGSSQFLLDKSDVAASLASISSRENYIEKLQKAIKMLQEKDKIPKKEKDVESCASNPDEEATDYA